MESRSAAYRQAREKRILLDNPRQWKVKVWENMGWHWSLSNGNLVLYYHEYGSLQSGSFSALLSSGDYSGTGECFWTTRYHSKNPNLVVADQLKVAKAFVKKCQQAIDSVEK